MNSAAQTAISSDLSAEVRAFAAEKGVTDYLPAVLEMTWRIYPARRATVYLEEDAEIAGEWSIVIGVDISALSVEQLVETEQHWAQELFAHCPAPLVCNFVLGMDGSQ